MNALPSSQGDDASLNTFLEPFKVFIADEEVTEVAVNDTAVWIEKNSRWVLTDVSVKSDLIERIGVSAATFSNQRWDKSKPLLSASLPNGLRIQLVRPPAVANNRYSLTIRKPSYQARRLADHGAAGLFDKVRPITNELQPHEVKLCSLLADKEYEAFMKLAVSSRLNIVVSGPTGSGKTTFMKSLAHEIPISERIITIEDVRELFLPHQNAVHLLYSKGGQAGTNVGPKELLESCLRMKPDRILLAEVRGDECLYFVRSAASGHPGSMTSCHANSTALAFEQMAIMIQDSQGGANLTFDVIKRLLMLTIDVVIQFQNRDGERFISEIYFDPQKKMGMQ